MSANDYKAIYYEFWKDYFDLNNISIDDFTVKLLFKPKEIQKDISGITCFESELKKEFYIELVEFNTAYAKNTYKPYVINNKRCLYKYIPYTQKETYKIVRVSERTGPYEVIFIPFFDLELVMEKYVRDEKKELKEELNLTMLEDAPLNSMTIRDFYCIINNVPLSRNKWLNELINQGINFKNQKT